MIGSVLNITLFGKKAGQGNEVHVLNENQLSFASKRSNEFAEIQSQGTNRRNAKCGTQNLIITAELPRKQKAIQGNKRQYKRKNQKQSL